MRRALIACVAVGLCAGPVLAASPQVETAVKVFQGVGADPAKLKSYCEMTKAMDGAGETPDAATEAKIEGYMKQLGPSFETAWNAGENVEENSPDGQAYGAALDALFEKCGN
jgi:hypothetical protein